MRQSLITNFRKVSEAAAVEASAWNGRSDQAAANSAATAAVRKGFSGMNMSARVVVGARAAASGGDGGELLRIGEELGRGGDALDVAVDSVEGTNLVANNQPNALTAIAYAPRGSLMHAPAGYMFKVACGPAVDPEAVGVDRSPAENVRAVARSLGKDVADVIVCILDRERHRDLIREVHEAGARVRLIYDGDVQASIGTAIPGNDIDLYIGEGGGPEGVLACAGLKAVGGFFQARFVFRTPGEREVAASTCDVDVDDVLTMDEIVRTRDAHFVATGVTNGEMLRGIQRLPGGSLVTDSVVMSSIEHTTTFIKTIYRAGGIDSESVEPGLVDSIF